MQDIYERLPQEPLDMPEMEDLQDEDSERSSEAEQPNAEDEIMEEFRRERARDDEMRLQRLGELGRKEDEKRRKKEKKKKKKEKKRVKKAAAAEKRSVSASSSSSSSSGASEAKKKRDTSKKIKYKDGVPQIEVPELTIRTRRRGKNEEEPQEPVRSKSACETGQKKKAGAGEIFNF